MPIYDWGISGPKMFTFDLLTAMRAETSLVLDNRPIRSTLMTKDPNIRKYF